MTKKQAPLLVTYGRLNCPDYPFSVEVDSEIWFDWLEKNKSFRFEMEVDREISASSTQKYKTTETASFTAYKERRRNGHDVWCATRKVNGKLWRGHLGESERLTWAKLEEVARKIHANCKPLSPVRKDESETDSQELHTYVTDSLGTLGENERLKAEVARLEGELFAAAADFQKMQTRCLALQDSARQANRALREEAVEREQENQILKNKLNAIALRIDTLPADRDLVRSRDAGAFRRALQSLLTLLR